jgi:hypothetical protein
MATDSASLSEVEIQPDCLVLCLSEPYHLSDPNGTFKEQGFCAIIHMPFSLQFTAYRIVQNVTHLKTIMQIYIALWFCRLV